MINVCSDWGTPLEVRGRDNKVVEQLIDDRPYHRKCKNIKTNQERDISHVNWQGNRFMIIKFMTIGIIFNRYQRTTYFTDNLHFALFHSCNHSNKKWKDFIKHQEKVTGLKSHYIFGVVKWFRSSVTPSYPITGGIG